MAALSFGLPLTRNVSVIRWLTSFNQRITQYCIIFNCRDILFDNKETVFLAEIN